MLFSLFIVMLKFRDYIRVRGFCSITMDGPYLKLKEICESFFSIDGRGRLFKTGKIGKLAFS